MAKNSLELKDFVNDPTFIENMNRAFSDLRADYELSMVNGKPPTSFSRPHFFEIIVCS